MGYSKEEINKYAEKFVQKLMNEEYLVETLPNTAVLYHQGKEIRDSQAMRAANPNSRLFRATFEK